MSAHMRRVVLWSLVLILAAPAMLVAPPSASAATTLRAGSRGSAVVQLQTRLTELRYDIGPVDGIFGPSTKHAVIAFQKVNGLTRDGIVGAKTRAAMERPVVPKVRRIRTGSSLEVDLTRQIVLLVRDGKVTRIVDTSTGKASTPTPVGTYRIERRIDGYRTGALGTMWRPAYFHRGYAFHGYPSVPSYPASHGCVRMTNSAMNRLWPHLKIGTPVQTYR